MTEETFSSFAKTFATLQKLTKIESSINAFIASSKIPHAETRKFLRCETPAQASNTPLFQFLNITFKDIGIGELEVASVDHFKHTYMIAKNPIATLYPDIKGKRTCYVISDALSQFYSKDMGLMNVTEEMECMNAGSEACSFEINLQPLSVYQIVLDKTDKRIVEAMVKENDVQPEKLAEELLLETEDMDYRLDILRRYHLLENDNSLTRIGLTYSKYGTGPLTEKEEDFSPPWENISTMASAVASAGSFAEAFTEASHPTPIWEVDESEIINLAEEAKKSKGFAELLSTHLNKEKDKDEGGN